MALSPNLCLVDVHISKVFVRKWKMNDFSQNVAFEVRENSKKKLYSKGESNLKIWHERPNKKNQSRSSSLKCMGALIWKTVVLKSLKQPQGILRNLTSAKYC